MNEIRLKVCMPGSISSTVRVDESDKISGWTKTLLRENGLNPAPETLTLLRNGTYKVSPQNSFADAGFSNGDELHITIQNITQPTTLANEDNELDEIVGMDEGMSFHQLGVLLLDGSESMEETGNSGLSLAEWVNRAVREFLGFFKRSSQVNNFSIAIITFDTTAVVHTPITPLKTINDFADYNPLKNHGGGTNIGNALIKAEELCIEFFKGQSQYSIPFDAKIIVMSDGLCQSYENTIAVAGKINQNSKITICSSLFTLPESEDDEISKAAETILSTIASEPGMYKKTYKEADLRQFFISSMSAKRKYTNGK